MKTDKTKLPVQFAIPPVIKTSLLIITSLIVLVSAGCQKEESEPPEAQATDTMKIVLPPLTGLAALAQKDLTIQDSQFVYTDITGKDYYQCRFDRDKLRNIFKIRMNAGTPYRISLVQDHRFDLDFLLLNADNDTLCIGHDVLENIGSYQITWTPTVTDTYFISATYRWIIQFEPDYAEIIVEENRIFDLTVQGLDFTCNGDWFVSNEGYLGLAMHRTGLYKWARLNQNVDTCRFTFDVTQASGFFRNYIGFYCYSNQEILEWLNKPRTGYAFYVCGPGHWEYNLGGSSDYGQIPQNLPMGTSYWYNLGFDARSGTIHYLYNNETMKTSSLNIKYHQLYLMVADSEHDTIYFKNITLSPLQ
ncbi:MAG TPA: hypothetical protein VK212_03110 [Lentimicrobium sp.]|nr:hypothetical protein [Lentimicrobium sp.]